MKTILPFAVPNLGLTTIGHWGTSSSVYGAAGVNGFYRAGCGGPNRAAIVHKISGGAPNSRVCQMRLSGRVCRP